MSAQVLWLVHLPFNLQMLQLFLPGGFWALLLNKTVIQWPYTWKIAIRNFCLCIEKENCRIIECGLENIQAPPSTPSWLLYKALITQTITHSISTYLCYWNCLVSLGSNKPSLETSGYALENFTKCFSNVTFHKSKKTVICSHPKIF